MTHRLTPEHHATFANDGFLVIEDFIAADPVVQLADRFEGLFRGEFETGIQPDEWNWREGRDSDQLTRQICNGWKADSVIAATVLSAIVGEWCAELRGWPGARINQDNVIWKPPGAKALGFHQDESYQSWIVPAEMMTCWITLDDTFAEQGTIEYVRASHLWGLSEPIDQFHAPADPTSAMYKAAKLAGVEADVADNVVPVVTKAGTAVFHHGKIWHGSRENKGTASRRSVVSHCMSSESVFHPNNKSAIYSRYQRGGQSAMDESFFPVLWHQSGYRTNGI